MNKRAHDKELMDLGSEYYSPAEYKDCLYQLERIGRLLGGDRATFKAISHLDKSPASIIDVGCGGGALTLKLAKRYPNAQVVGVDTAPEAIEYARSLQEKHYKTCTNASFKLLDKPALDFAPRSFDIVTASLLCHHLNDEDLVAFLKSCVQIARHAVVINDLHRHPIALGFFSIVAPILFPNRMIEHDGKISIRKAFTRKEWIGYLQKAGIPLEHAQVRWHFPFRWTVSINT